MTELRIFLALFAWRGVATRKSIITHTGLEERTCASALKRMERDGIVYRHDRGLYALNVESPYYDALSEGIRNNA